MYPSNPSKQTDLSRRIAILTLILLGLQTGRPVWAQDGDNPHSPTATRVTLTQSAGPAYGVMRDLGVSPRLYQAPGMAIDWSVDIERGIWRYQWKLQLFGGALCHQVLPLESLSINGADVRFALQLGLERQVLKHECWQVWAGAALEDRIMLAYNNRYMNASVGMGNLLAPTIWGTGECHFNRITLWLTVGGSPLGGWYRPGFAYLDNYSAGDTEVATFGNDYNWQCTFLPHLLGGLGVSWQLPNGNALGVTYGWHYFTTRKSGYWSYEGARHALQFVMTFEL